MERVGRATWTAKPYRVAASELGDERVHSRFAITTETNRTIQRCFAEPVLSEVEGLNMTENSRARE
jgi:hypothetical protein